MHSAQTHITGKITREEFTINEYIHNYIKLKKCLLSCTAFGIKHKVVIFLTDRK